MGLLLFHISSWGLASAGTLQELLVSGVDLSLSLAHSIILCARVFSALGSGCKAYASEFPTGAGLCADIGIPIHLNCCALVGVSFCCEQRVILVLNVVAISSIAMSVDSTPAGFDGSVFGSRVCSSSG